MKKIAKILLVIAVTIFISSAIACVIYVIIYPERYHDPTPLWINIMALAWVIPVTIATILLFIVNRADIFRDIKKFINS